MFYLIPASLAQRSTSRGAEESEDADLVALEEDPTDLRTADSERVPERFPNDSDKLL